MNTIGKILTYLYGNLYDLRIFNIIQKFVIFNTQKFGITFQKADMNNTTLLANKLADIVQNIIHSNSF